MSYYPYHCQHSPQVRACYDLLAHLLYLVYVTALCWPSSTFQLFQLVSSQMMMPTQKASLRKTWTCQPARGCHPRSVLAQWHCHSNPWRAQDCCRSFSQRLTLHCCAFWRSAWLSCHSLLVQAWSWRRICPADCQGLHSCWRRTCQSYPLCRKSVVSELRVSFHYWATTGAGSQQH